MKNIINQAAKTLKEGGIIAYPTEGVFGFGCDPFNKTAVMRLLKIKNRSAEKGLLLIASSWKQVNKLIRPGKTKLPKSNKNQPITWIIPKTKHTPVWVSGKFKSVAIRITLHPIAKNICKKFGGPIISTSANIANQAPATTFKQTKKEFTQLVDFVVPGLVGTLKKPTTICELKTHKLIRN